MKILERFSSIWGQRVLIIDNNPVTVGKFVVALGIVVAGIVAVRIFNRTVGDRLFRKLRFRENTSLTIRKIINYFAYVMVFLFALRLINVPLTAFAFLGGAIAIGVGFGAQNLINNFISGFIIMAEQPIAIGNLIELDGVLGMVEEIGARSTRVRTGENIHILVPNSAFLEKNITNWTLSDNKIRTKVVVGVIYGSPVGRVKELLLKASMEIGSVLRDPEPFVIFSDFGDNALIFEVHFWVSIRRVIERRIIESSVRFRIDDLFREAGIVIAFPQRDVHLDTTKPLELRLLNHENGDV
jgi:potassium efflux system protein